MRHWPDCRVGMSVTGEVLPAFASRKARPRQGLVQSLDQLSSVYFANRFSPFHMGMRPAMNNVRSEIENLNNTQPCCTHHHAMRAIPRAVTGSNSIRR